MAKEKKINKDKEKNIIETKPEEIKSTELDESNVEKGKNEKNISKIYIGPTIPKYNLQENTIFINKYPENVEVAIKEYPDVKSLMLNTKDITNRNQEIYKMLYKSLKEEIGGK